MDYLCWVGDATGPRQYVYTAVDEACMSDAVEAYWTWLREEGGLIVTGNFGINIAVVQAVSNASPIEYFLETVEVPKFDLR